MHSALPNTSLRPLCEVAVTVSDLAKFAMAVDPLIYDESHTTFLSPPTPDASPILVF